MNILHTDRLVLSPPTEDDVEALTGACQDPEVLRWTTLPSPYGPEHAEEFVEVVARGWATGRTATWAIRLQGTLVGMISLMDEDTGDAELGFWLIEEGRGRGLMTEAGRAVCEFGFGHMGLSRITWRAQVGNHASAHVARRLGFHYEGTARLGLVQRGRRVSGWTASLLSTDDDADAALASWPADTFSEPLVG